MPERLDLRTAVLIFLAAIVFLFFIKSAFG